jgi:hypothetical protein
MGRNQRPELFDLWMVKSKTDKTYVFSNKTGQNRCLGYIEQEQIRDSINLLHKP